MFQVVRRALDLFAPLLLKALHCVDAAQLRVTAWLYRAKPSVRLELTIVSLPWKIGCLRLSTKVRDLQRFSVCGDDAKTRKTRLGLREIIARAPA
jgi:hypothetical protein